MTNLSRRKFIATASVAAATTVVVHGCSSSPKEGGEASNNSPSAAPAGDKTSAPAPIANGPAPETTKAKLGFIALTDSAPLIIAKEKGFFDKYGMKDVEVLKQASWPVTRDNLVLGSEGNGIDGAHILSPMPYLMATGKITQDKPLPMYILARLNTNGQAISVGNNYKDLKIGKESKGLKDVFAKAKSGGKELKVAVTFPGGTHDLWLRYWLAAGGIDPNSEVSVVPVPPPQMVANMKVGNMEAFCVGEPWNAQLVNQKIGFTSLVTGELWNDHPEKALTMRADWVDKHPNAAKAILMAVMEAQQWCENNKDEMVKLISASKWLKVPEKDIIGRFKGEIDYGDGRTEASFPYLMKFWKDNASYPYKSHDIWFVTEDIRWGYLPADTKVKELVDKVNREDMWKEAAKALNIAADQIPASPSRGVETFFDGVKFDPEKPEEYLKNLKIKKVA